MIPSLILHTVATAEIVGLSVAFSTSVDNYALHIAPAASLAASASRLRSSATFVVLVASASKSLARAGVSSACAAPSYEALPGVASSLTPLCLPAEILAFATVTLASLTVH